MMGVIFYLQKFSTFVPRGTNVENFCFSKAANSNITITTPLHGVVIVIFEFKFVS